MPAIKEYSAPEGLGLRPTETGINATAAAARRVGAEYSEAGAALTDTGRRLGSAISDAGDVAVKYIQHQEISHGTKSYAELFNGLTQQWNATIKDPNLDPNDPTVAATFREKTLEPALEQFKAAFLTEGGQKFAQGRVDHLRQHLFEKTASDMSTQARHATTVNIRALGNNLSNAVYSDPSGLSAALNAVDASITGLVKSSPTLSPADAGRAQTETAQMIKEQIVKAAVIGAVRSNPDAGMKIARDPRFSNYITGAEVKQFENEAKRVDREDRAYQSWQRTEQKQQKADASEAAANDTLKKIYIDKNLSPQDIVRNDDLLPTAKERLISILERETKPDTDAKISNRNYLTLLDGIRSKKVTDVDEIYETRIRGDINRADFNQALKDFTDLRSPEGERLSRAKSEFFKAVKPSIDKSNPLMGKIDQDGSMQLYRFEMDVNRKVDEYRKAGKNWQDLFDPSKPDFLGQPKGLLDYQKTLNESIKDQTRRLTGRAPDGTATVPQPGKPLRKPGESAADYLKRIGAD